MKKQVKGSLSLLLAAAVILGTIPALDLNVMAAGTGPDLSYEQALDKACTIKALTDGDRADFTVVNKSSADWEHSPSGKALKITASGGETRVHLPAFGDGVVLHNAGFSDTGLVESVSFGDAGFAEMVSAGDGKQEVAVTEGNPGLADVIYEISMRTGETLYGNVGFLARYKDENNYAGMTIDFSSGSYTWGCQYSKGGSLRANKTFSNSAAMIGLKADTDYLVELTCQGTVISCRIKEQGSEEYIDLGSHTMAEPTYYTGPGGLAIRLNPGTGTGVGGKSVIIDNVVQKNLDGTIVTSMDFEDGAVPEYKAYENKGTAHNPNLASLSVEDILSGEVIAGFGEEKVNRLTGAGGIFVDEASPDVANGIYTVKVNGSTNQYGLVFHYADSDNYAALRFNGTSWVVEGRKEGNAITGAALSAQPPVLTAGKAHTFVLDYSDLSKVTLKVDDQTATELGDFTNIVPPSGRVGFVLGAEGVLYTDAVKLAYFKGLDSADPGLPEVELQEGQDVYTQAFADGKSTLAQGDITVPSITVNQPPFGLDDKALSLKAEDDRRIKFTYFNDGPADGSYEFAFRTGDSASFSTVGFLARYVDESMYTGLSIDGGVWQLHAATSQSGRQNTPFPVQYEALRANTTYKARLDFKGNQVSVKVMKEGDGDYTDLGIVTSQGHTDGGAFAVRMRTAKLDFFMDNIIQYDGSGNEIKRLDFNDGIVPEYEVRSNRGTEPNKNDAVLEIKEGYPTGEIIPGLTPGPVSNIAAAQPGVYVDLTSPVAELGSMTVQLKGTSSEYGIVFNYKDNENYSTIQYDGTKWIAGGKSNGAEVNISLAEKNIPAIAPDDTRTLRLAKEADGYTLLISAGPFTKVEDYSSYKLGNLEGIYAGDGKLGVVAGKPMTLYAGPISSVYTLKSVELPYPAEGVITIKSGMMQAVVGDSFPHIYAYLNKDGSYLTGTGLISGEENTGMEILTQDGLKKCTTESRLTGTSADSATYEITARGEGVEAVFTVMLKAADHTLELHVTDVKQNTGTVRTFAFEDLKMAAVAGRGAGAAMGTVNGWGPARDTFIDLKSSSRDTEYKNLTYVLFFDKTSGVTAAVENNAEKGTDKYVVKQNAVYPYLSASNTAWAWQYYENSDPSKNMPYAKVAVGGDANGDNQITWQDAGIAYRDIMMKAYGSENTKNEWMYIAMNMSSGASQPFLRVLDEAKAISYLTDGFGMKIMNKGYQAGGHDDSHGDYDFVGDQQGGVEDFNTLIEEGLKYGIKNGVHINATEFALDGYETEEENLTKNNGELVGAWGWFDKAFNVNKSNDISKGDLERRLDDFEEKVPDLDFFYVDVYQSGSNYNATEFIRYMNENGASVGTEALGDFNQQINFVHWNTDSYYSTGGEQSEVLKFVVHGLGDLAAPDRALMGELMPGVADWRNVNDFNEGERVFYRNNLPTKYLQHFELLNWIPDEEAVLSGNVRTKVAEENGRTFTYIYKDDKMLAKIDTTDIKEYNSSKYTPLSPSGSEIFIPWSPETEDKIYCYNDTNTSSTWDIPDSWNGVSEAYLYPLTENGRDAGNVQVVPVVSGKVELTLKLSTPYILVKEPQDQAHRYNADGTVMTENGQVKLLPSVGESEWGYGSPVKNFGFSGKTFEGWTKNASEGSEEDIAIDTTIKGSKGNPRAVFQEGVTGSISQTVAVESNQTYSFSAWTMAEGERSPKLTVKAGDVTLEASVLTTKGIPVTIRPSKYNGMNYQRLKVNITIPEGVTQAEITFSAESGAKPVYVDDFRCWEWMTSPNEKAKDYYYFEDFENVDENWGPFISQVSNQPFIHLSYKNPEGGQMKYYTLDTYDEEGNLDITNLTSLKGRQNGSYTNGIMMRTLPSTIDFKKGASYLVEMDYATYLEELFASEGRHIGYNYPLNQALYYMDVRSADGTVIESYPLKPSTFKDGEEGFNARPSTEKLSFVVDASEESGIYLTLRRDTSIYQTGPDNESDSRPTFVIDNIGVTVKDDADQYTVSFETTPANASVAVKDAEGQIIAAQNGKTYFLEPGKYSYTVSAEGYVTKTADFTVSEAASIKVELEKETILPKIYQITFITTPENASVLVQDEQGNEVAPSEGKKYELKEGKYSYTVSADGYVTKTAFFTVNQESSVSVELEKTAVPNPGPDDNEADSDSGSQNAGNQEVDWNQVSKDAAGKAKADGQSKNSVLNVVTGNKIIVPSNIFKTIKNQNITVAFHTGQGTTFSVGGNQIPEKALKDGLDLSIRPTADAIPSALCREKTKGAAYSRQISMVSRDSFGMTVNLHLSLGKENAEKYANLYSYNNQKKQLEYMGSFRITSAGQAMFGIRKGADFLVTVTDTMTKEKAAGEYTVAKGDTLSRIAARNNVRLADLLAANPQIKKSSRIYAGQKINLR